MASVAINPNTVLKAYRELEYEGLVQPRPGLGTFVTRTLGSSDDLAARIDPRIRLEVAPPEEATWVLSKEWLTSLNLQQRVKYIGNEKFWALQWRETGLLLVASALLAIFCFWWIRRRVA